MIVLDGESVEPSTLLAHVLFKCHGPHIIQEILTINVVIMLRLKGQIKEKSVGREVPPVKKHSLKIRGINVVYYNKPQSYNQRLQPMSYSFVGVSFVILREF